MATLGCQRIFVDLNPPAMTDDWTMNKTSIEVKKLMADMDQTITGVANFLAHANGSLKDERRILKEELAKAQEFNIKQRGTIYKQRQAIEELSGALARVAECLQQMQKT